MELLIFKLAVAVIPLITLISILTFTEVLRSRKLAHRPLSYHRTRKSMQKALAAGIMLR